MTVLLCSSISENRPQRARSAGICVVFNQPPQANWKKSTHGSTVRSSEPGSRPTSASDIFWTGSPEVTGGGVGAGPGAAAAEPTAGSGGGVVVVSAGLALPEHAAAQDTRLTIERRRRSMARTLSKLGRRRALGAAPAPESPVMPRGWPSTKPWRGPSDTWAMTDYTAAIALMFERNIVAAAPELREPTTDEPARARRILALLVETLSGFAYGTVAGQLARGAGRWLGAEYARFVRTAPIPLRPRIRNPNHDVWFARALAHAPLDLGQELELALETRLALTVRELAELARDLEAPLPDELLPSAATMFSELSRDSGFEDRLAREIGVGWEYACAAIERRPATPLEISTRARDLWETWSRLAGMPIAEPVRDPVRSGGYIALVG